MAVDISTEKGPLDIEGAVARLSEDIEGEVRSDRLYRMLYAQDASVYQNEPIGVVFPRDAADVQAIMKVATTFGIPLIPRAAGTSLAGQCVGEGLVVDLGRHMNEILEVNPEEGWVRVQPGVILDDLNRHLAQYDLFFGPDTSTSNRCMLGGMIGNNSCGSHSIYYGNTREHVLELELVLSDGSRERVGEWSDVEYQKNLERDDLLGQALRTIGEGVEKHAELIEERYPRPDVIRRNTGYPFDDILIRRPFADNEKKFSLPRFLCGTEGTLALTTEAKLNVVPAPKKRLLVCAHFESLEESLEAVVHAVEHDVAAAELMDRRILDETKKNLEQRKNRFFVEGDPAAILAVEFYRETDEELEDAARALIDDFQDAGFGYAYPIVRPPRDKAVWELRKAGLGLLMGIEGDRKPVTVVEDTAVSVQVLPEYISEFAEIMEEYGTQCVYYAHASVGELHLRPELNLKDPDDVEKFKGIARDVADLVQKFGGAISGEHGDGRLRAPLLERFYGSELMDFHAEVKRAFDPQGLLNPGKILDPPPMDEDFRFEPGEGTPDLETAFDWSSDQGLIRAVEKCNGAGACRKRAEAGGTMCPSYMATLDERDSTRGRANVFRQLLTSPDPREAFTSEELESAMDLCLSCKACKSECPASVDMARMKAEFLQQNHDAKGTPASARFFGNYQRLSRLAALLPWLTNFLMTFFVTRALMGWILDLAPERSLPTYASRRFSTLFARHKRESERAKKDGPVVWLYADPFTEFTEPEIGMAAVRVLEAGGYQVELLPIADDGRTMLSKGLVRKARELTRENFETLEPLLARHPKRKIVGIEPSSILTFRDETPDLAGDKRRCAEDLARRSYTFEEFVDESCREGRFEAAWSDQARPKVILHGHCHQKALVGTEPTRRVLEIAGYDVEVLETGCCGMAGSFGYEAAHYDISMEIGELVLFPAVRGSDESVAIAAPGTSCRHQIMDGTERKSDHPAVLLDRALAESR
ncbi:MAG: FAD-binding and (Fe-S)-binding domain-containing protein [Myxococcota bacterium]